MSVALHGDLKDFGIAEVFQLIGQQRKTGTLVVNGDGESIFLAFDKGCVVRGGPTGLRSEREPLGPQLVRSGYLTREQLENLQRESQRSARPLADLLLATGLIESGTLDEVQHLLTKETVFEVMRRKHGEFHFTAEHVSHKTKPENLLGAEQILMDGLRMLDEWQTFTGIVPSPDAIVTRTGNLESARALTQGDSKSRLVHAERVLQLIDGRLSVRRVIDLSRIGTFEATRALAELRQAGVIDLAAPPKQTRRSSGRRVRRMPILPLIRVAVATALPFVVLGLLLTRGFSLSDGMGAPPGSPIPNRTVQQLGGRYETDLVRNLVEARFFEAGAYPATLAQIETEAAIAAPSLTQSRLADYYYVVRDDEVVLLAPVQ
jgi:hypothetical protein